MYAAVEKLDFKVESNPSTANRRTLREYYAEVAGAASRAMPGPDAGLLGLDGG